ncbi:MAG: phosphate/phosphite/phosphonate ABC transporter substrate-binding protein [Sulfuricaulis sp.]
MKIEKLTLVVPLALLIILFAKPLAADSSAMQLPSIQSIAAAFKKVAFTQPQSESPAKKQLPEHIDEEQNALVFSAPPRETAEAGKEIYQPVADYLSKVIGKKVVYKNPGTWGVYRTKMLEGSYDIVFDGPHFNSYRMEKLGHNILVKIPERHEFAVIVRKDETSFKNVQQMAGYTFCTHAPPNLGTLILLNQFDNPSRQPVIINTKGWDHIYQGVVSGKCAGGVIPVLNLKKYDRNGETRIVFKTQAMPNQAFSAGPRVSLEDQQKIARALVSPEAAGPTAKLRATYRVGNNFVPANNEEYRGMAVYLRNEWGYY